nr:MAG: hypothetical protein [Microvirus sp.]
MSPLGDIPPINYTSGMKNETKQNEQTRLGQKLRQGNPTPQEEFTAYSDARRRTSLIVRTTKGDAHLQLDLFTNQEVFLDGINVTKVVAFLETLITQINNEK